MRTLLIVSTLFIALSAQAAGRSGLILTKREATGFIMPAMSRSMNCDVYANRIEISKTFAGVSVKEVRPVTLDYATAYTLVAKASTAKLEVSRGPVDGPSKQYAGYLILPTDVTKTVELSSMNGGNGTVITNPSAEAEGLRRMLDEICQ